MSMVKLMTALHKFQKEIDPEFARFSEKHIEFCNRFDELSEEGSKDEVLALASDILEEYGEQYYRLKEKYEK
jgi:hypothetical protein